jgi:UDP-GlcNAc3NAcA epimerase
MIYYNRPETEWIETLENGWNILSDYTSNDFETNLMNFNPQGTPTPVFGENVAKRMVELILSF